MCVYVCVCVGVGSAVVSYDGFKIGNTHHILIKSEITGVIIIGLHAAYIRKLNTTAYIYLSLLHTLETLFIGLTIFADLLSFF